MKKIFEQEIEKGKRHFFVYYSPVSFPFTFAIHPRILTVSPNNEIYKYQIHSTKNSIQKLGYVHINDQDPMVGDNKYIWKKSPRYKGKQLLRIVGGNDSLAEKLVNFMRNKITQYPFKEKYRYVPGPNSNTFVSWVFKSFPEIKKKLPWNAFGKHYKIK